VSPSTVAYFVMISVFCAESSAMFSLYVDSSAGSRGVVQAA
jgi:hypothetical protein